MRIAKVLVVLLGSAALVACSGAPDSPGQKSERVLGGKKLTDAQAAASSTVLITVAGTGADMKTPVRDNEGSGMLLSPTVVLTAAHVIDHTETKDIEVIHASRTPSQKVVKVKNRILSADFLLRNLLPGQTEQPAHPHQLRVDLGVLILQDPITPTAPFPVADCDPKPTKVTVSSAILQPDITGLGGIFPVDNVADFKVTSRLFNFFTRDFAPNPAPLNQAPFGGDSGSGVTDFTSKKYVGWVKTHDSFMEDTGFLDLKLRFSSVFAKTHGQFTRLVPALCSLLNSHLAGALFPNELEAGAVASFLQQVDKDLKEDVVSLTPIADDTAALTIDRSQLGKQTFEVSIPEQASVSGGALGNFDGKGQALAVIQDDQLATVAFNKGPKPALTGAPGSSYTIVSKVSIEGDSFDDLVAQRLSGEIDVFKGSTTGLTFAANIKPFGIRLDKDMLTDFVWLDGLARIHTVTTQFGHFSQNVVPDTLHLDKGVAGRFRALSGDNDGIEDFVVMGDDLAILCESTTFGGFICDRRFEGPEVSGRHVTDVTVQDLTADGFDDLKLDYSDGSPRVVLGQTEGFGSNFGFLVRAAFPVDVNGDDELDTMTLDDPNGLLEIGVRLQPEGTGDFKFPTDIPFDDPKVVAVGNLNDDGVANALAEGFSPVQDVVILTGGSVYALISNGDGSFEITPLGVGSTFTDVALVDTNGDGIDDVEAVEEDGSATVFAGSSTGVEDQGINFTGLPTPSSTDGKMMVLSGLGVDTVAATQARFRITATSSDDLSRLVVDVFDGDNGGFNQFEEQTSLLKTCYRLSADPCGDGNLGNCAGGPRPPVHLVTVTSDTLGDDKWAHIYDGPHSAQASFGGNGQAPFVYELRVFLAQDCSQVPAAGAQISVATADAFKVRANAMLSQPLGEFSFVGSSTSGKFGVAQPYMHANDYDGTFNLPIAVGSSATEIQLKESDADDTEDNTQGVSLGANPDIQYRLLRPNGTEAPLRDTETNTVANMATNPSGNNNGTTALDVETRIHTIGAATPGIWTWQWQGVGASNSVHIFAPFGSPTTHEILGAWRERPVLTNAQQPTFWQAGSSELAAVLPVVLGAQAGESGASVFVGSVNDANDILNNPAASLNGELARQLLAAKLNVRRVAELGEHLQAGLVYGRTISVQSAIVRADAVLSGANLLATEAEVRDLVGLLSSVNLGEVTYQWPGVPFPDKPMADTDGDGVFDLKDNCPPIANPLQEDSDDDWIGDACRVTISACVLERAGGIRQAFFSYDNPLSFRGLPVGARNRVTLAGAELLDANQPVELAGGFLSNGFSRVLGTDPLTWTLDGASAIADLDAQACSGRELARLDHVPATALFASEALELGEYTSVESSDGRLASVASGGELTVGPSSVVGNAVAGGRLEVKDLAAVLGVGLASQGITRAADALVRLSKEGALPEHSLEWEVEFGAGGTDQIVRPRQQIVLEPGHYGHVVVDEQAQLSLRAGAYQFASLTVAAQGNLQVMGGEAVVHVASGLEHEGETDLAQSSSLVLAYFGSSPARVSSSLHATVIAPRAALTLGELPNSVYTGAFFAKRLTVRPTTQVFFSER